MRIGAGQHMRMDQRMKLAPRMIQSMEILQLSSQALLERIEQELVSNPTLELRESEEDVDGEPDRSVAEAELQRESTEGERELVVKDDSVDADRKDDFERLTNIAEEYGEAWEANTYDTGESYRVNRAGDDRDAKMDAMANTADRQHSLSDQLLEQWQMVEASAEVKAVGEYLLGFIDEDGYLRMDNDGLLSQAPEGVTVGLIEQALGMIQQGLEPIGIGARNLQECLLLQIDAMAKQKDSPDLTVERLMVKEYLKDIEANRLPKIAAKTDLSLEQIKTAIGNLRQFHPRPGRMLFEDQPHTISPDAIVEYDEAVDRYVARLTHERMPALQINRRYLKMTRDRSIDRKTRDFVGGNLQSAKWLLEAIEQRQNTLQRVVNVVIEAQREFFDHGPQMLKPLPMTLVADQLGIHVATVSRAVSEKYVQTPRGILPLRMFFSGGTETEGGDAMSWAAVQAKLNEIIDAEDKTNPLSDDELVVKLKEKGIEIARRTVAKYRKQLNIQPARQRKQF